LGRYLKGLKIIDIRYLDKLKYIITEEIKSRSLQVTGVYIVWKKYLGLKLKVKQLKLK
jgi:hypothetical protein